MLAATLLAPQAQAANVVIQFPEEATLGEI